MTIQVELSSGTFSRLQNLAVPLVDTIEAVLARVLDFYERGNPESVRTEQTSTASPGRILNPATPPNLRHAKVVSASLDGRSLPKPTWNGLLEDAVRVAKGRARDDADLQRLIIVPFVLRKKEDEGYKHLADIGLSIQRQDSNTSWKAAYHIAKQLRLGIEVGLVWRHKEDAAFPGETARLAG